MSLMLVYLGTHANPFITLVSRGIGSGHVRLNIHVACLMAAAQSLCDYRDKQGFSSMTI